MDNLIEAIKNAVAPNAPNEARTLGAHACRTILAALETPAGEPLAHGAQPTSPMQVAVAALRGMPPDQLLDLAIARLKAALPAGTEGPTVQPMKIPLLPLPASLGGRS